MVCFGAGDFGHTHYYSLIDRKWYLADTREKDEQADRTVERIRYASFLAIPIFLGISRMVSIPDLHRRLLLLVLLSLAGLFLSIRWLHQQAGEIILTEAEPPENLQDLLKKKAGGFKFIRLFTYLVMIVLIITAFLSVRFDFFGGLLLIPVLEFLAISLVYTNSLKATKAVNQLLGEKESHIKRNG